MISLYLPSAIQPSITNSIGGSFTSNDSFSGESSTVRRTHSSSTLAGTTFSSVYMTVWKVLVQLALGPHKEVADMAKQIVNTLKLKVKESLFNTGLSS